MRHQWFACEDISCVKGVQRAMLRVPELSSPSNRMLCSLRWTPKLFRTLQIQIQIHDKISVKENPISLCLIMTHAGFCNRCWLETHPRIIFFLFDVKKTLMKNIYYFRLFLISAVTFFGTFFGTKIKKIDSLVRFLVRFLVRHIPKIFIFFIFSWYEPPCTKNFYFVFGTNCL
jgi:hypothetical protein